MVEKRSSQLTKAERAILNRLDVFEIDETLLDGTSDGETSARLTMLCLRSFQAVELDNDSLGNQLVNNKFSTFSQAYLSDLQANALIVEYP